MTTTKRTTFYASDLTLNDYCKLASHVALREHESTDISKTLGLTDVLSDEYHKEINKIKSKILIYARIMLSLKSKNTPITVSVPGASRADANCIYKSIEHFANELLSNVEHALKKESTAPNVTAVDILRSVLGVISVVLTQDNYASHVNTVIIGLENMLPNSGVNFSNIVTEELYHDIVDKFFESFINDTFEKLEHAVILSNGEPSDVGTASKG